MKIEKENMISYNYDPAWGGHYRMKEVEETHYRTEGMPIAADSIQSIHSYSYDPNGNLAHESVARKRLNGDTTHSISERKLLWDGMNRLKAISENGYVSLYWYDADGNRTVKEHGGGEAVWVNSKHAGTTTDTVTYGIYPNPYFSVSGNRWTKHYYIGGERIASRTGTLSDFNVLKDPNNPTAGYDMEIPINYSTMRQAEEDSIDLTYARLGVPYEAHQTGTRGDGVLPNLSATWDNDNSEEGSDRTINGIIRPLSLDDGQVYFYHRDHLGSTMSVTDSIGNTVQQVEYTPWGEVFVERRLGSSGFDSPYLFNGKELDEETGLYYYGARYYDPKMSVWYSTDPMHNMKPFISDYSYCLSNPFSITDPSGMLESTDVIKNKDGTYKIVGVYDDKDNNIYVVNKNMKRTGETIGTTLRPYDFMDTNDQNGSFINKIETTIDLNNLYVNGKIRTKKAEYSINHADANDLLNWGKSIFWNELGIYSLCPFYLKLLKLSRLSKNKETLDFKLSLGLDPYTPIRAGTNSEGKPIITTLRAVGNILFGANVKSTKPLFIDNDVYYIPVMIVTGAYNQQQNHGNGYNPGYPYYGEHTYSGSFIYYGYYGKFY